MSCRVVVLSSTAVGKRCIAEGILPVAECTLAGIITTPRRIRISHSAEPVTIHTHAQFDDLGARAGCDVVVLGERPTAAAYLEPLQRWRADLLLALGWYYLVPRAVRASAAAGCLGIHASLLPKYRGGAPIPWAIINGEHESGVTLFHLEDEPDAGDIVAQCRFPIGAEATCADVLAIATDASVALLGATLPRLARGEAPRTPQRHQDATWCRQRRPEDGLIDWRWPAERVHNFVRAQTRPYSGAFTHHGGERITIWRGALAQRDAKPGEYSLSGGALLVGCGRGSLLVHELGSADGKTWTAGAFAARYAAASGRFDPR